MCTWRSDNECEAGVDPAPDGLDLRRREQDVVLLRRVERVGPSLGPDDRLDGHRRLLRFVEGDSKRRRRCRPVDGLDLVTWEALPQVVEREKRVVEVDRLDLEVARTS